MLNLDQTTLSFILSFLTLFHNSPLTFSPGELTPNHTILAKITDLLLRDPYYAYRLGLGYLPSFCWTGTITGGWRRFRVLDLEKARRDFESYRTITSCTARKWRADAQCLSARSRNITINNNDSNNKQKLRSTTITDELSNN